MLLLLRMDTFIGAFPKNLLTKSLNKIKTMILQLNSNNKIIPKKSH